MAAGAPDAGDDEDDVISLSSKASTDPPSNSYVSDEWQGQERPWQWPRPVQDEWQVLPMMQPAPQPAQIQNGRAAAVSVAARRAVFGMQNSAPVPYLEPQYEPFRALQKTRNLVRPRSPTSLGCWCMARVSGRPALERFLGEPSVKHFSNISKNSVKDVCNSRFR